MARACLRLVLLAAALLHSVCEEAEVEVVLAINVDAQTQKDFVVPAGQQPEGAALIFCGDVIGTDAAQTEQLVDCVMELSSRALVERVRRALPADAALPPLDLEIKLDEAGTTATFSHDGARPIGDAAVAFCAELVEEPAGKPVVKDCAANIVSSARRKVIEATVAEEVQERRKTIDDLVRSEL